MTFSVLLLRSGTVVKRREHIIKQYNVIIMNIYECNKISPKIN